MILVVLYPVCRIFSYSLLISVYTAVYDMREKFSVKHIHKRYNLKCTLNR